MSLAQQTMLPKLINKNDFDDVSFQYPSGMGKSGVYLLILLYNLSREHNARYIITDRNETGLPSEG